MYTVVWVCWNGSSTRLIRCTMVLLCKSFGLKSGCLIMLKSAWPSLCKSLPLWWKLRIMISVLFSTSANSVMNQYCRPFHCQWPFSLLADSALHHLVQLSYSDCILVPIPGMIQNFLDRQLGTPLSKTVDLHLHVLKHMSKTNGLLTAVLWTTWTRTKC